MERLLAFSSTKTIIRIIVIFAVLFVVWIIGFRMGYHTGESHSLQVSNLTGQESLQKDTVPTREPPSSPNTKESVVVTDAIDAGDAESELSLRARVQERQFEHRFTEFAPSNRDWWAWYPMHTKSFSLQGTEGAIEHACRVIDLVWLTEDSPACLGESVLYVVWNGERYGIDTHISPTLDEHVSLSAIAFTEGSRRHILESDKAEAYILVTLDPHVCRGIDGVCIYTNVLSYRVSVPSMEVHRYADVASAQHGTRTSRPNYVSTFSYLTENFYWNESGTKGVFSVPCPAGCPAVLFEGFDVKTGEVVELLTAQESTSAGLSDHGADIIPEWVNENTVRFGTIEKTF